MSLFPTAKPTRVGLASTQNVFILLLALRVANALLVATFFQPDEYFQSLEPAWNLAFGDQSGAWITWVCYSTRNFFFESPIRLTIWR
jgi:hypothetical protein